MVEFKCKVEFIEFKEFGGKNVGLLIIDVVTSPVPSIFVPIFFVLF